MPTNVTIEFELPIGYEDSNGILHTTVVMRMVKNSDTVAIQKDINLQRYAKENLEINSKNPVSAMRINSQMIEMFSLLFSRVIVSFGSLSKEQINRALIADLYQNDMNCLMTHYAELNGVDIESAQRILEGEEKDPLP